ncbi:Prephenate/arogenate dehydrogenase domain-containing protein [Psidium guajava]|nr:Prephenate/arogenate dehydrogenase domain-containing protein [Psidium guajava]
MDEKIYRLIGADYPGNRAADVKNLGLGWMIGFLFVVSFLGLFSLVPLQKVGDVSHILSILEWNS